MSDEKGCNSSYPTSNSQTESSPNAVSKPAASRSWVRTPTRPGIALTTSASSSCPTLTERVGDSADVEPGSMTVPTGGVHRVACTDVTAPGPVDPITEPTDLATAATIAGLSKFHFHRLFSATYGATPAQHLSQRRIERAQDYLRATNLTVTEVCMAVGYSSLGSFSSRFREIVGQTPSAFQAHDARNGAPRVPGCFVFMRGITAGRHRAGKSASEEKLPRTASKR